MDYSFQFTYSVSSWYILKAIKDFEHTNFYEENKILRANKEKHWTRKKWHQQTWWKKTRKCVLENTKMGFWYELSKYPVAKWRKTGQRRAQDSTARETSLREETQNLQGT